ncbi:MAG TPA: SUMF1/EgtB/PvdO family nonheme iron enzyme [Vicinamibacterales bacterium]|nr:SUMF1/EgtB/PvdO family nonheme iron enzyme [Vicinamibacterales bacterium]
MIPSSRTALLEWYRRNRDRSRLLFELINEEAYYSQPIALRHPIVFYEGHLPGFSFNTFMKRALGARSLDPKLETLFARGIDPDESPGAGGLEPRDHAARWPSRATVRAFADEADRQIVEALPTADFEATDHGLDPWEAAFTMLEHEAMHQETLLYMWHRLPFAQKVAPAGYRPQVAGASPRVDWIDVPDGCVTLGVDRSSVRFAWDNECPALSARVESFAIERHDVTNERFLEFVEQGGYRDERWWAPEDWRWIQTEKMEHPLFWERHGERWHWRGMFESIPLPLSWPVYVSMAEASAFARWNSARLPTEAEFQRAAYGAPDAERQYPWGTAAPSARTGAFDFDGWDPQPAGSHPEGASAWGVEDLVGNGWEWTSTPFAPFPGFHAMASYPEYSADFFDGKHFVMKGASVATARELIRPTFRNWFRPRYPYVYATFRCVRDTPSKR